MYSGVVMSSGVSKTSEGGLQTTLLSNEELWPGKARAVPEVIDEQPADRWTQSYIDRPREMIASDSE